MTIKIYGLVQGVGFRPYVKTLADELSLNGNVRNDGGIVTVNLQGKKEAMDELIHRLSLLAENNDILPGSIVERIEETEEEGRSFDSFTIIESTENKDLLPILPPDIKTCDSCLFELFDPNNRRYRNPFISCVSCGPRYTIMKKLPYDRENTTMADFKLCPECEAEFYGKKNTGRRHFAQTICCNDCGPKLFVYEDTSIDYSPESRRPSEAKNDEKGEGNTIVKTVGNEESLRATEDVLLSGGIAAIKDIGGYHIAFDAFNEDAEERLRNYKERKNKPFAVMFKDIETIKKYAYVSPKEEELLNSPEAPIVLLRRKEENRSYSLGGGEGRIGAFLPSNPVQHLLFHDLSKEREGQDTALVMTSGNHGGEPIITEDEKMLELLKEGMVDIVLSNDRDILYGMDDSVYQVTNEIVQIIRRARGLVPKPVYLPGREFKEDVFAAGGDLKSVFAFGKKNAVYLSGHFGDLENEDCIKKRRESISHMESFLSMEPKIAVSDKHPLYVSVEDTKKYFYGKGEGHELLECQHHKAHVLSVVAEHGLFGKIIGAAFDGTGYGDDGTIWGGEFFLIDTEKRTCQRVDNFHPIPLLGGDKSAKDARVTALCYSYHAYETGSMPDGALRSNAKTLGIREDEFKLITSALKNKVNVVENSSLGRGFDSMAAMLSICNENTYEGECAAKLQYAAERYLSGKSNDTRDELAYLYHKEISSDTVKRIINIRDRYEASTVVLSGGCFINSVLLNLIIPALEDEGFKVYLNEQVPPGDGGIALGQCISGR